MKMLSVPIAEAEQVLHYIYFDFIFCNLLMTKEPLGGSISQ